jgi:hypothetical protein
VAGGAPVASREGVLEVRGGPDMRAPAGSDRKKKKRGRGKRERWAGDGRLDGSVGREREKGRWAAGWVWG